MKTIFEVNEEVYGQGGTTEEINKLAEFYEQHGFTHDKENQNVYKEFDKLIQLNEGDRLEFDKLGFFEVYWKCYDVENDVINYAIKEQ